MNAEEMMAKLFSLLDQQFQDIVIKDFVGFMNWNNALGTTLLSYTGHHSAFCTAVKQNSFAYDKCARCSHVHQYDCTKYKKPFSVPCFLGLSEYSVPIMIDDLCIGSISAGLWCSDPAQSEKRIRKLSVQAGMDCELLLRLFSTLPQQAAPVTVNLPLIDFIALLIAEIFRPFAGSGQTASSKYQPVDSGFNTILTYIRNNYTDPGISVSSIAKACNYSNSYVSHTFNRYMNTNIRTYINQLRIILAKHELKNGNSVSMTAMVCGYSDYNYFTTIFHRLVGISASQYASNRLRKASHRPLTSVISLETSNDLYPRKKPFQKEESL